MTRGVTLAYMKTLLLMTLAACWVVAFGAEVPPTAQLPEKTIVSATLDVPHEKGLNLIWCNSFQLAWNALGIDWCGEPLRLKDAAQFEKSMNASSVRAQDVDAQSLLVKVGKVSPAFLNDLNAELKKRFGDNAPSKVAPAPRADSTVMAYAYLCKTLAFAAPFDRRKEPLAWRGSEGAGAAIEAFGIMSVGGDTPRSVMQQVQIISYARGEFIVELKTKSTDDHLILALVEPGATLKETVDAVRKRVAKPEPAPFAIQISDHCLVPCIQLAVDRAYQEIIGKEVLNEKLAGYSLCEAKQSVRFKLDEKGAALKSEAEIHAYKNGHQPRQITLDRPFLLYLERNRAENPYLAIWFENPNLFVKGGGKVLNVPNVK